MSSSHCFENPPKLSPTFGSGSVVEFGGFKSYVTGNQGSKFAILMIADAFGYEVENFRKLADKIADSRFLVVAPDFYYGDQYTPEKYGQVWVKAHDPDKGCENAKTVIAALKTKGVTKVGVAGFCWGGMVGVRLAKFNCMEAAILLHPGWITEEQINEVKTPLAILGAENDDFCTPDFLNSMGDILSAKAEVDSFVKIFPRVGHGWTTRYKDDDEFALRSALESHSDILNWLNKYIK